MASSVVGALRVNLGADTAAFSTGMRKATSDLQGFGRTANNAGRPTRAFTSQLQNAGYQISDVAVQISGGTSALRAFGQQLPQLLGGFGIVGALGGTLAAVGLAVASSFTESRKEAGSADEAVRSLSDAMAAAREAGDLLGLSQGELAGQFGAAALGAEVATNRVRDSIANIFEQAQQAGGAVLRPFQLELEAAAIEVQDIADRLGITVEEAQRGRDAVTILGQAFQLPREQAEGLLAGMEAFRAATTTPALSAALVNIYNLLSDWKLEMQQLPPEAEALRAALSGVVGELGAATAQTNELTGALSEAAAEAARLREIRRLASQEDARENVRRDVARDQAAQLATTEDSRNVNDRGVGLTYSDRERLPVTDPRNPNYRAYTSRSSGGGGGGGGGRSATAGADRELEALKAKATSVFNATRTPMEAFQLRMGELNGLVQAGVLDWDTYNRAVLDAQEELGRTAETGSNAFSSLADDAGNMVAGLVQGTTTVKDAFAQMFAQIGSDLISSGISGLFRGAIQGNTGGGFFSGIGKAVGIPGFAAGTNFAPGGLAWVGERGPELVDLPRGSKVIPNNRSTGMGSAYVEVRLTDDLDARIVRGAGRVVQAAAPQQAADTVRATQAAMRASKKGWR